MVVHTTVDCPAYASVVVRSHDRGRWGAADTLARLHRWAHERKETGSIPGLGNGRMASAANVRTEVGCQGSDPPTTTEWQRTTPLEGTSRTVIDDDAAVAVAAAGEQ